MWADDGRRLEETKAEKSAGYLPCVSSSCSGMLGAHPHEFTLIHVRVGFWKKFKVSFVGGFFCNTSLIFPVKTEVKNQKTKKGTVKPQRLNKCHQPP